MARKFTLTFSMENDALRADPAGETVRILQEIAGRIKTHGLDMTGDSHGVRDINGNTIGNYKVKRR